MSINRLRTAKEMAREREKRAAAKSDIGKAVKAGKVRIPKRER